MPAAVPTDEIYERYLKKAISEINDLGDELARAGDELRVPVVGSGHPLADVMLLKFSPQPSEIQEGVAFFGRSGQAVLKSLQRLHVDPLAVYGTNCLKFGTEDPADAAAWLTRELHIVQPKLLVAMGERRVDVRRTSSSSRSRTGSTQIPPERCSASRRRSRRSSRRTSTRRSTRRRRRRPSGTPSRRSAPGGRSSRRTEVCASPESASADSVRANTPEGGRFAAAAR